MKKELIYIACPYSHKDSTIVEYRYKIASLYCAKLIAEGEGGAFSPLTHSHPLAEFAKLPTLWSFWEKIDRMYLSYSKELIVLTLEGWEDSTGVQAEIEIAKEFKIPIKYVNPIKELNE